jgi:hypothetical protein
MISLSYARELVEYGHDHVIRFQVWTQVIGSRIHLAALSDQIVQHA